jgi:hypothetical protein
MPLDVRPVEARARFHVLKELVMPKSAEPNPGNAESTDSNLGADVDQAIRALSEAARQPGVEAHSGDSAAVFPLGDRQFVKTWSDQLEALLTAGFEIQNSLLATAPALFESVLGARTSVFTAWMGAVHDQQTATLSAWRQTVESTEQVMRPSR